MHGFTRWLLGVGVVIVAGILVPYAILGGGEPSFDILIFWCLFGAAIVVLVGIGVARWRA
ncbi:hypothetical protein BV394_09310 [Brevirhabdus pacifica]|uniref:Uncharacterized protein n=1 Tax=Brevirhabdus pacifica TaxID=1267768 RepID=A0A1U7DJ45_9RHOB|nr:hypothetical protein [Brevirhabdus pacifica]APX89888.1 hypothetical protein BV394_09310 [Brevirhabdus pacifica]OWU74383.1 hypothetical protein ATO5_14315 [Loktanella sp. 22II-4b]PJJ82888.1 hypothetical protein CLV77_2665 [Brevirhabdus pacifica]